jgi:predicted MFS family arabinose efflux permease
MPSPTARRGLNGLNFFHAAVQTGFGPFIAVYLTERGWNQTDIGVALSIGTAAGLISQLPSGMLVDLVHRKRSLTAAALVVLGVAALLLVAWPATELVWASQILHALASGILVPALAALTLALVGHEAFSAQLGVNARYGALGNAVGAGVLGVAASHLANGAVFVLTAALVIPALLALWAIRPEQYAEPEDDHPSMQHPRAMRRRPERPWHIYGLTNLHVFAACTVLFHMSNAAMLPLALNGLAERGGNVGLVISAAIIVPQMVAALIAPRIGDAAQRFGRRPVLVAGFLVLPLRGLMLAAQPDAVLLSAMQALDGVSGAVFGIMVPLIAADVTRRTGYFNLAISSIGVAVSIGATISTTLGGLVADRFGISAALLGLAAIGAAATLLVWLALPETRPAPRSRKKPSPAPARTGPT